MLLFLPLLLVLPSPTSANIISAKAFYTVTEEQGAGILVGNIKLKLPANQRYTFKLRERSKYFRINRDSGELHTAGRIDLEMICRSRLPGCDKLSVTANAYKYGNSINMRAFVEVTVQIVDKNDHAPIFRSPMSMVNNGFYEVPMKEGVPISTRVSLPDAVDGDYSRLYNRLSYSITSSDTFTLESTTNRPVLRLTKELDREQRKNYTLTVTAKDTDGKTGRMKVLVKVLDVDDNPAIFQQSLYTVKVSEATRPGTVIYNVTAEDKDEGELRYKMDDLRVNPEEIQVLRSLFRVDENGQIVLIGKLDFEVRTEYTITIVAFPDRHNSFCQVRITVTDSNDNGPEFVLNPAYLQVIENRAPDQPIGVVTVRDADSGSNGQVSCFQKDTNSKIQFIKRQENYENNGNYNTEVSYDIKPQMQFDRETLPKIVAVFTCSDSGKPQRTTNLTAIVNVVDVNDNYPKFRKPVYKVQVPENNEKNKLILQVNGTDEDRGENSRISYSLPQDGDASAFKIDRKSGQIFASRVLDRERKDHYEFKVIARDNGSHPLSSTAEVVITVLDTNDHKPELVGPTHFNVSENRPPYTLVGHLKARDPDLNAFGAVTFEMDPIMAHEFFVLKSNGSLYTSKMFNREQEGEPKNMCINVKMRDGGHGSDFGRATICVRILDVNDNPPHFTYPSDNATIFLSVNEPPGKLIASVRATDPDEGKNARVRYELGNNLDGLFTIGDTSGDLRLATTRRLLPEDIRVHKITVHAWDCATTPLSSSLILRIVVTQTTGAEFGGFMSGRRNVIIVIILSSVSGVLALVLITAIICMVRPCRVRGSRRRQYQGAADSYAAAKPGWCSPLDEMRLHNQNEYSGAASPAMSDQPLSLCVDSARPDATLFKHSLTCPRNSSLDGGQKVCLKHMDTMRSPRPYETLERKPLPAVGRPADGDGQQSDSGRGASDEDLSASAHHHHSGPALQTFHPGYPSGGGTLRTRHIGTPLNSRQMALRGQTGPTGDYTLPRPGSSCAHGPPISEGYEVLRRQQQTPPVSLHSTAGHQVPTSAMATMPRAGLNTSTAPSGNGSRVDAEKLVEEIDQLFFKDMML